jgi:hypothetical protein
MISVIKTKTTTWPANHINHYNSMGFKRVCRVKINQWSEWYYESIDREVMFSKHTSWTYFITVNGTIVKIGQTGVPLGIENEHYSFDKEGWESQPRKKSDCRIGRYRTGDGTDYYIRTNLRERIESGDLVEFWAYQCPESFAKLNLITQTIEFTTQYHKQLELSLLDYFHEKIGSYPELNKGRK